MTGTSRSAAFHAAHEGRSPETDKRERRIDTACRPSRTPCSRRETLSPASAPGPSVVSAASLSRSAITRPRRRGAARPHLRHSQLDRLGRLEHEHLDREVRVDVVLAHEGDHLAIELPFDDCDQIVTHRELVVVAELEDPLERPFSTSLRSPFVSVSASRTVTTSSLIRVFAFVGPRPVYSCSSCTARSRSSPRARCLLAARSVGTPSVRFLGGCVHHERERKRRSPNSSVWVQAYSFWALQNEKHAFSE